MQIDWNKPGDTHGVLPGPCGDLETWLSVPEQLPAAPGRQVAVLMHPHPQYAGSMHNKVISTLAWAFLNKGIATVRFQFRGVGASAGSYGNISGEVEDARAVMDWLLAANPGAVSVAGFSFGAYVAAAMTSTYECKQLLLLAPSIARMPYASLPPISCPGVVIQGVADEVVDVADSDRWALASGLDYVRWQGVSHFFHGQLVRLRQLLLTIIANS